MNTLISFIGDQDPYHKDRSSGEYKKDANGSFIKGPILSLLDVRRDFEKTVLFYTENEKKRKDADFLENALKSLSNINVVTVPLLVPDPKDHAEILKALRHKLQTIYDEGKENYYMFVTPGTPAMHACLLLLAASNEFPAKILDKREERYKDQPLIKEIDPDIREFPRILPPYSTLEEAIPEITEEEIRGAIGKIGIIGDDKSIKSALAIAAKAASTDDPVLILGETGTGKELFARFIHEIGKRSANPLHSINCSAFTETLLESELFGHVKGAFTGAIRGKKGIFEVATGSTLFLDEIGDMSLTMQAKLLRTLGSKTIQPVGGEKSITVDVRIISATNKDLAQAIKEKIFREDLYYRVNTMIIKLPSLRERADDIPKLALNFIDSINRERETKKRLTQDTLSKLKSYYWRGNIRELKNIIKRASLLAPDEDILPSYVDMAFSQEGAYAEEGQSLPDIHEGFSLDKYLDEQEKLLSLRALQLAENNQSKAASILGLASPSAFGKKLKKHDIKVQK